MLNNVLSNHAQDLDSSCKLGSSTNDVFLNEDHEPNKRGFTSSPSTSPRSSGKYGTNSVDSSQHLDEDAVDNAKSKPIPISACNVNMNSTSINEVNNIVACSKKSDGVDPKLNDLSSSSPIPSVQVFPTAHR